MKINECLITIVVPVFNEQESIFELHDRLVQSLNSVVSWNLLFVDDGSNDATLDRIRELTLRNPQVGFLSLSRNFGHQQAVSAGLEAATGDAIVLMDADLQDAPEHIPLLLERWIDGYDVVVAVRQSRNGLKLITWLSKVFYQIQSTIAESPIVRDSGTFCLMDRDVVLAILRMQESSRYFPGLRGYVGFRQTAVPLDRDARLHGRSRVGLAGLFRLAHLGVFGYSTLPLRIVTISGIAIAMISFSFAFGALVRRSIFGSTVLGWPFGLSTAFLMFGILLFALGIIGEYIGLIYREVQRRPSYFIREAQQPISNGRRIED